jgi:hypothetical protein
MGDNTCYAETYVVRHATVAVKIVLRRTVYEGVD